MANDLRVLTAKENTYQGSWKKRGGIGAFMMTARKWDRLDNLLSIVPVWDIFAHINNDATGADGTVLAEIRDLRQYLILIEAEMYARGCIPVGPGTPEDGGHHEKT